MSFAKTVMFLFYFHGDLLSDDVIPMTSSVNAGKPKSDGNFGAMITP